MKYVPVSIFSRSVAVEQLRDLGKWLTFGYAPDWALEEIKLAARRDGPRLTPLPKPLKSTLFARHAPAAHKGTLSRVFGK